MALPSEILDLVIVGAGVYGICAANTYLSLHPSANIKVLDSDKDAGGVWSTSRSYPKFWSQTGIRLSGFPDKPFKIPDDAETYHDLFEAKYLSKYLEDYLTEHEYEGRSLRERFVFGCWVSNVARNGEGVWEVKGRREESEVEYRAKQIIIATGLYAIPSMPEFAGREAFRGPVLHQKDFAQSKLLDPDEQDKEKHTHITVLGGSKSASDIAYAAATDTNHPRRVTWIIRTSGRGPLLLNKAHGFGKYNSLPELGSLRATAALSSANPFVPESWFSWFLHKTFVGEWLLQKIWSKSETDSTLVANYAGREGALPGFEGLKHTTNTRWRAGHIGLLQRDDFWDVVAKNVQVYRGDVARLTESSVILQDGTEIETDVLLCATGWKQELPFFSPEEAARIGLPFRLDETELVETERRRWSELEQEADRKVLARWPYLATPPEFLKEKVTTTSYKLYNLTVPLTDHGIAFLGQVLVPNSYHTALAQTLYAIAALDGMLKLPPQDQMAETIAFSNRWCMRRYPAHGQLGNVCEFEMVSFTDRLLEQLGLSSHRHMKPGLVSWWKDLTDPCLASDYAGLVDEYRAKYADSVG